MLLTMEFKSRRGSSSSRKVDASPLIHVLWPRWSMTKLFLPLYCRKVKLLTAYAFTISACSKSKCFSAWCQIVHLGGFHQ